MKNDHIRIRNLPDGNHEGFCEHCGKAMTIVMPISMGMFLAISRQFLREHRHCPPPAPDDMATARRDGDAALWKLADEEE